MATKPLPSPEVLRQLLRYEPDTGRLFWLPRPRKMFETQRAFSTWNARYAGVEALKNVSGPGYLYGCVNRRKIMAHRVAWAIYHGSWPEAYIDHINGQPGDNRIVNLRAATPSQNQQNQKKSTKNTSGYKGVSWCKARRKWRASISYNRRSRNIGFFDDPKDAYRAYCLSALRLHGEFARLR